MPFTDFGTVGSDVTLDIFDPQDGTLATISGITGFNAKPMTQELEHHGLEGADDFATIYRGWMLSFDYDRKDGRIDTFFATREARYRAKLPMQTVTITQTISERDGSVSQYRFTKVELTQEEAGTYNREDKVSGRINGRGTRTKVT